MDQTIMEKVKATVKKLLSLAEGPGAFDGEITAAMNLAAKLMDKHHLDEAECRATTVETAAEDRPMIGAVARFRRQQRTQWENVLGAAVSKLVGTVLWITLAKDPGEGPFKKAGKGKAMEWYGPEGDARLAADLFTEWQSVIATIATGKYRDCFRGDGWHYANGFAEALYEAACEAERARHSTTTTAIVKLGMHNLAEMNVRTKQEAKERKELELGHPLATSSVRTTQNVSGDAFAAGKEDGARADFGFKRPRKLTDGNTRDGVTP